MKANRIKRCPTTGVIYELPEICKAVRIGKPSREQMQARLDRMQTRLAKRIQHTL